MFILTDTIPPSSTSFDTQNKNSYTALADTAATHNYLNKTPLPFCKNTETAQETLVKVANRQILKPILQNSTIKHNMLICLMI